MQAALSGRNQITAAPPAAAEECANKAHRDSRDHLRPAERLQSTACPVRCVCNRDRERSSLKMVNGHQQPETPTLTFGDRESSFLNLLKAKGNGGFS